MTDMNLEINPADYLYFGSYDATFLISATDSSSDFTPLTLELDWVMSECAPSASFSGNTAFSYTIKDSQVSEAASISDSNACGYSMSYSFSCSPTASFITFDQTSAKILVHSDDLSVADTYTCTLTGTFDMTTYGSSSNTVKT